MMSRPRVDRAVECESRRVRKPPQVRLLSPSGIFLMRFLRLRGWVLSGSVQESQVPRSGSVAAKGGRRAGAQRQGSRTPVKVAQRTIGMSLWEGRVEEGGREGPLQGMYQGQ